MRQPAVSAKSSIAMLENKQWQVIQEFMNAGLDINHQFSQGNTLLHVAVKHKRWGLARKLLENGADPHVTNSNGDCATHLLVQGNEHFIQLHQLLDKEKKPLKSFVDLAVAFSRAGADLEKPSHQGKEPLGLMREHPQLEEALENLKLEQKLSQGTKPAPLSVGKPGMRL